MAAAHDQAIVLLADRSYAPAAFLVARQALTAALGIADVILITDDQSLPSLVASVEPRLRTMLFPDELIPSDIPRSPARPKLIYGRLLLGRLLGEYRRILYLDADLWIFSKDIARLFTLDLGECSIAAVRDLGDLMRNNEFADYRHKLGLDPDQTYFNSGVMLIDLPRFNNDRIGERALEYVTRGGYRGILHDQSALNHELRGKYVEISPLWNWLASADGPHRFSSTPPLIVHFAGGANLKPWGDPFGRIDPFYRNAMRQQLAGTPWADFVKGPRSVSLGRLIGGFVKHRIVLAGRYAQARRRRVDVVTAHLKSGRFADFDQGLLSRQTVSLPG